MLKIMKSTIMNESEKYVQYNAVIVANFRTLLKLLTKIVSENAGIGKCNKWYRSGATASTVKLTN